jgi:class 3 adenylate cyclase/tetratricopeptide (TPR) repeat protein
MSSSVTATFVFTDLVDSTATAARLGPEGAEDLRQTHVRLLRGAVAASGGIEVKNLGDGLMVMYTSPSRALSGAVGMQQAIEHHNRSAEHVLAVRVGASTGEAVEDDGDYFGDPVIEAARLCASAAGGQIVASDLVRLLVGRNAAQTFVEIGPIDLKGIPEPVNAVEVLWDAASVEGSVPLPGRLVGAASDALFGFFGRLSELAALDDTRKRAHASQRCQVTFVAGEAGMGKTALVAKCARTAHEQGSIVLFGHADEDLEVAYQPWIEVVSFLVRNCDPAVLDGLRPAQRGALARLAPEAASDSDRVGDPDTERLLLLEGTTELLAAASRSAPVLLVLDDLHWADAATLQLLRHVITATRPMDVTLACTYRDTDLGRGDPLNKLLADLHREANVSRLPLRGLEDDEICELLAAAAGHDLDDTSVGFAHALRRETDGNPFFTGEILRHLGESGGIVMGDDGRWAIAGELEQLGLPSSVRDVVGRRVERLGDEARRVLCLAAVIGREFDVNLLTELADTDEDSLLDLMDAAVAASVLTESAVADRYRFAHALIQHSLYDELSPARRHRTHQRVAERLEARATTEDATTLAELARHWVAATRPADLDKALGYVRRAGDAARDALAPDNAIRWYQQALELVDRQNSPDEHLRAGLLAELGSAQRQAGYPEYRETLLGAAGLAEQLDDTTTLVRVALGFPMGHTMFGDADHKRITAAALDRIGSEPTPARARLLAALSIAHDASLEWRAIRDLSLEAVQVARQIDDDPTFVEVSDLTFSALATPDRVAETVDDLERAVALADRTGDPTLRARSRFNLVWAYYQRCDMPGVDAVVMEIERIAEQVGMPHQQWQLTLLLSARSLLLGNADEADAANERALQLGTAAAREDAFGVYGGLMYAIRRGQGRVDEIADLFLAVARDNPSIAALRAAIPLMLCDLHRVDEARERLVAETATDFDLPYDMTWLASMSFFLDVAATTAERTAAQRLVDRLAPYSAQVLAAGSVVVEGALARPLARAATLLGDYDQAQEWFSVAHQIHARLQAPFWTAMGRLDHADLCLARRADGDLERARDLVTTAAATAAEFGCAGLTERAEAMLAGI